VIIRPIQSSDFEEISDIGTNNYPDEYYESNESFISKVKVYSSGCFVCLLEEKICGYIISFPYFHE
jgi:formate hydrogenlyase subunit 6/NADH:ubiquinone oxidoreductase subunit I